MNEILSDLKRELRLYSASVAKEPTSDWVDQQTIALLQQYPSGISKTVLLTELEHRWRSSLKRGENTGKLKQALSTMQLSLADVLVGELTKIDEYRCIIQADGVKCGMMVHRQLFDWTLFLQSVGVEALTGRTCMLTCCRLLNISPPLLLPTPLLLFVLRMSDPLEAFLVLDVFFVLHQAFVQSFVRPHIAPRPPAMTGASYATAGNCEIQLPDNSQTLVLFAEVLGNSAVRQYNAGAAGAVSADYQLVTLRLQTGAAIGGTVNNENGNSPYCVAYLILFDDQVSLSRMWRAGDLLQVYRPYLRANAEEETIFGTHRPGALHNPAHTMTYSVVQRADPCLCDHLPLAESSARGAPGDLHFMNYHLLYGSVTVISKIETAEEKANKDAVAPGSSLTSGIVTGTGVVPHSRLGPVLGRLLGVSVASARSSSASEKGPVVELWLQLFARAGVGTADASVPACCPGPILRVRYLQHLHRTLYSMVSFPGTCCNNVGSSVGHILEQHDCEASMRCLPIAQAGQLVSISGLCSLHSSVVSLKQANSQHSAPPQGVLQYLLSACSAPSSGSDVSVLNCALGDGESAEALFKCDPADRSRAVGSKRVRSAGEDSDSDVSSVSIAALCSLPALACSPSLALPLSLKSALAQMHAPSCGCIFVQASIQPLHPSVRLCCPPAVSTGTLTAIADPAAKRARTRDSTSVLTADGERSVLMGYQLMRLRDGTGEALCVIESNVLVLNGGPAAQPNELQEVRHRLVNTTSSLYLDSSTGQLVRLQQSSAGAQPSGIAVPVPRPSGQQQQQQFSMLLSRIDDGVDCAIVRAIAVSQRPGSTSSGNLPIFRIEAICDANPAAFEALRAVRDNK